MLTGVGVAARDHEADVGVGEIVHLDAAALHGDHFLASDWDLHADLFERDAGVATLRSG